jgi:hypothetical protein
MKSESIKFIKNVLSNLLKEGNQRVQEHMNNKNHSLEILQEDIRMCEKIKNTLEELEGFKK